MQIEAQFVHSHVPFNADRDEYLVLTLTAPPTKGGTQDRPPLCVLPVVDVSGSMSGEPLYYVKQSVLKLFENLRIGDYTGLVVFGSSARVVIPLQRITAENKAALCAEVGKLGAQGGTNFAGGLLAALQAVDNLDLPRGIAPRVIMFTDGQANAGPAVNPEAITELLQANRGRTTVSAFGYGGATHQFLTDFSKEGQGNYAFVDKPDTALTAFGAELGSLLTTHATNVRISIKGLNGHTITRVVSDVEVNEDALGEVMITLPSVLEEEVRHVVVCCRLREQKQALPREVNAMDLRYRYATLEGAKEVERTGETKGRIQFVRPEGAGVGSSALQQVVDVALVVEAQIAAEVAARKGDYAGAQARLNSVAHEFAARGNVEVSLLANRIGERYGTAQAYNTSEGYRASMGRGLTRGMDVVSYAADVSNDLAQIGTQVSNTSMRLMADNFTGGAEPPVETPISLMPGWTVGTGPTPTEPSVLVVNGPPVVSTTGTSVSLTVPPVVVAPVVLSPNEVANAVKFTQGEKSKKTREKAAVTAVKKRSERWLRRSVA